MVWVIVFILVFYRTCAAQDAAQMIGMNLINNLRQQHHAMPLKWNADIADFAFSWSNYLVHTNRFEHSTARLGENLAMLSFRGNATENIVTAINLWYAEMRIYNFSRPGFSTTTGHATALVWRKTTDIGIGYAVLNRRVIVCANFWPPGNMAGAFDENVKPLLQRPPQRVGRF